MSRSDDAHYWTPLADATAIALQRKLREHPDSPNWTVTVGDKLVQSDVDAVDGLRGRDPLPAAVGAPPTEEVRARVAAWRETVPLIRERTRQRDLEADWSTIPPTEREDLALRLVDLVPPDADTDRLIAYDTSGTTGHAIDVPTHPRAIAQSHALLERALAWHGVVLPSLSGSVLSAHICCKRHTYTFATTFSVWKGAGFVKVNLRDEEWPDGRASAQRFLAELNPSLLSGDPIAFAELIDWEIAVRPLAIVSSAVALSDAARHHFEAHFGCPVLDWYSTTETGPLLCSHPDGGYLGLDEDTHLEVVDEALCPVDDGQWGSILVTGGRNPFLPLLRYRTGDRGRVEGGRITAIEGRDAVWFVATDGEKLNASDVGRALRPVAAFLQHQVTQTKDGRLEVRLRPFPGVPISEVRVRGVLCELFGHDQALELVQDGELGKDEKVIPYRRE